MKAQLTGANLGYGGTAVLRGVNFTLQRGERVVLLGPSGAGKSTLLAAIHRQLTGLGHRVALVPQDQGLVPQLSVMRNVYMGRLDDHGAVGNLASLVWLKRSHRTGIEAILADLGMDGLAARPVDSLSGGQRQRTAVGRALYRGGDIILADEPVSAVDGVQSRQVLDLVAARFDTALVALHDVDLARQFGTRIIGLRDGGIRFDDPADAVTTRHLDRLYA